MDEQPMPAGVVTFVLTDVEGSTALWQRAPTAMEEALRLHDKVICEGIASQGGNVLKSRGEGDSTFSVFTRPSDGLRAACLVQTELTRLEWPPEARLRVRIGVHTGEATPRDGDYFGTTVNRAARLRGIANGGEVLVSAAVAQLVTDHMPLGTSLRSVGAVRLRGLDGQEEVFALVAPGIDEIASGARGEAADDVLTELGVTRRERDVFDAIGERLTNAEIAERFSLSERTIESHVSALLRKLGATNRVELAARASDLAVSRPPELPAMLQMSARRSRCVGRVAEQAALLGHWEHAVRGNAALVVISGEAGIGKSRLAAEVATHIHARGAQVLRGASTDGSDAPYQPFVEALAATIASLTESRLRALVHGHAETLARLFPEVASRLGIIPPVSGVDPLGERQAMHDAVAAFVSHIAGRHPTLLVIEDLHWATSATRDVVLHIIRTAGAVPLLVLVTTRDVAPDLDETLTRWLADATRLPMCETVGLTGLDLHATAELIADLDADIDPVAAQRESGGNPLFVREFATAGYASPTLRDFLADRYARLTDVDLEVVDTAVVLGESFSADLVAAASGKSVHHVLETLERATDAGLIEPFVDLPAQFTFPHALFRSLRYDAMRPGRRMQLHAAVTDALLPKADDAAVLPELARHACIAAPLRHASAAVDLSMRAGASAAAANDLEDAAAHYQRALDVIDLVPDRDEQKRLQLNIRLGEALIGRDTSRGQQVLRDATRLARRLGDANAFADAVCSMPPWAGSITPGADDPTFIALAEEALALLPAEEVTWRSRLLALLGVHLALGSDPERGDSMRREAVEIARRSGDPVNLARATLSMRYAARSHERDRALEEAYSIGEVHGLRGIAQLAAEGLAISARENGDLEAMRVWQRRSYECTSTFTLGLLQTDAFSVLLAGDLDGAEQCNRLTRDREAELRGSVAVSYGPIANILELWRGRTHTERLRPSVGIASHYGLAARAMLALSEVYDGEVAAAGERLDTLRRDDLDPVRHGVTWSYALSMWSEVAFACDDEVAAAAILSFLDPYAGCLADGRGIMWCSVDLARSLLALTMGDVDAAESIAADAVAASRMRSTPLLLGRELLVMAAARRRHHPVSETADLVDEALRIADDSGAVLIRLDAERYGLLEAN